MPCDSPQSHINWEEWGSPLSSKITAHVSVSKDWLVQSFSDSNSDDEDYT